MTETTEKLPIVLPGGNGYLGGILADYFLREGHAVTVLSRRPFSERSGVRGLLWNGETMGDWAGALEGAAVINLAGRTVNCRYNEKNRREIYESRLRSTKVIGEAIARCANPPKVWINSSSATIYRYAQDRPMDEATGEIGTGFSVDVCQKWENALERANTPYTRKVALRSAMVFGPGEEGVFAAFHRLVRWGLAGSMGSGQQFVSWIHTEDFARSVAWILKHPELNGPVNCAAPEPLPNAEFLRIFRHACRQPVGLPSFAWMLEVGAVFLNTETELLLKSRRVVPGKLLASGFTFRYPTWAGAIENILNIEHQGANRK